MKDRFKFRVWHKKRKKMYEVLCLHVKTLFNGGEWATAKGFNIITQQDIHIQVEPKDGVIMQCTGLRDKNNNLIFEGDIVRFYFDNDEIIAVIEWDDVECRFYLNTTDFFKDKYVTDYEIVNQEEYEVIGNIYENPELLK